MFEVGDKVVCVDDSPSRNTGHPSPLNKGSLYVVERLFIGREDGVVGLFLVSITSGLHDALGEVAFASMRFRKLSDMQKAAKARRKAGIGPEVGLFEPMTGWRKEVYHTLTDDNETPNETNFSRTQK